MHRTLSYTEIRAALECEAQWDFRYGGHLAGTTLKLKELAPALSSGRAWGAGVQDFHLSSDRLTALVDGQAAIVASLYADLEQQAEAGFADEDACAAESERLQAMLAHYAECDLDPIPLVRAEVPLEVPIPARSGSGRGSSRYRFVCRIDGVAYEAARLWLVEYKLRRRLTSFEQVALARQTRWYAWAWWKTTGEFPTGVITDERWNEVPHEARILQSGKPSHAKDQLTTARRYADACTEAGEAVEPTTHHALASRHWQERHRVMFTESELEQAGEELVAAAATIGRLDTGKLPPIRHATQRTCGFCDFRQVCPLPRDSDEVIALLYDRSLPKRERQGKEDDATAVRS